MRRTLMKSKIHRATITDVDPDYEGSITIDAALMKVADLCEHERVQLLDVSNGARLETYVVPGEPDSGEICVNGAAALLVSKGDIAIVISYADLDEHELDDFAPTVVHVDESNTVKNQDGARLYQPQFPK